MKMALAALSGAVLVQLWKTDAAGGIIAVLLFAAAVGVAAVVHQALHKFMETVSAMRVALEKMSDLLQQPQQSSVEQLLETQPASLQGFAVQVATLLEHLRLEMTRLSELERCVLGQMLEQMRGLQPTLQAMHSRLCFSA